jgi:hypothetical protein
MPPTDRRQRTKRQPQVTNQIPRGEGTSQPTPRLAGRTADPSAVPPVLPGSTALREFCYAVVRALTLPDPAHWPGTPAGPAHELAQLRLYRDRARLVVQTMRRILADREIDDGDIMIFAVSLREELADEPADCGHHAGGPS